MARCWKRANAWSKQRPPLSPRFKDTRMDDITARKLHRQAQAGFRSEGVESRPYKEDPRALFRSVTRQVLFSEPEMAGELRYFEVAEGGFSTLERHQHVHGVMIL